MAAAAVALPKTFRAMVYDKPGTISVKEEQLPMPEPGPGEVLIELTHTGVCHSDLSVMKSAFVQSLYMALPLR